ncbi:MAG: mechanosensitive ion channel [Candidatus Scalindua sp.]|nr:mechanosensitive ion channel [Candidatus Scalindua sp.]
MIIRKLIPAFIILVSLSFVLTGGNLYSQPSKSDGLTSKRAEQFEEVKKNLDVHLQNITNLESGINVLKEELKIINITIEELIEDKAEVETIDLVTKLKVVVEKRINILNETIRVRTEIKDKAGYLTKALETSSTLSERNKKVKDEAALLPASQFEGIQKEVELLKAGLQATLSVVKEKKTYLSTSKTSCDASRSTIEKEKEKLNEKLETATNQKPSTREKLFEIDNTKRSLESEIKLNDEKVNLLLAQTELARRNLQIAQIIRLNKQLEISVQAGIADILSEKFKEADQQRKEKETEEEKKAEEERRMFAEEEKTKAELEKKMALKKEEIAVQKQLEETSPERKRVLAVEAGVHKQQGIIATIKNELITTGNERHKDRAEFRRIQKDIEEILVGKNTHDEIAVGLDIINIDIQRIEDKTKAIKSLLTAAERQKSIIIESLKNSRSDLLPIVPGEKSNIDKEAEGFSDSTLGAQLIKLAGLRVKHIEEQNNLIETKIDGLNERLELNKVLLDELIKTRETLSQIQVANVWTRCESRISISTLIEGVTDLKALKDKPLDYYRASARNLMELRIYLSKTENIPVFVIKVIIIVFVLFFAFFARYFLKRWARHEIDRFVAMSPQTFFSFELMPGLFRIMRNTLTMFFLLVIALTISLTVPSQAPIILSVVYGFTIISVYKLLRATVVEFVSPYTGERRWVPITYSSARHIFKGLNIILLFSVITITWISVLNAHGYKQDVIELLWFVYRVVTVSLAVWIAARQRSVLLKMLPYYESAIGKFVNRVVNILYPLIIVFVILLFAIRSLGYVQLTYTFIVVLIESVIVAAIASAIYRFSLRRLSLSKERKLTLRRQLGDEAFESEKSSLNLSFRIYKGLLDYGILVIVVVIIIGMWNSTFKDVVSSSAAPTLFREVYESVLYVFVSIKNGLTYRFTLAEGRYTTPFKMLIAILVLVAAFIFTRYLKNILQTKVYEKAQLEQGARHAISFGATYSIIVVAALIGLNIAGIPLKSLTIFAGAFGIGLGFGMQNIINNLVSGIIIFFEKPIKIGDVITLDKEIAGRVEKISIRSTAVKTFDRKTVVVPNSKFLESNVVNWVHGGDTMLRSKIVVGVAYGSDTELVKNCLIKVVDSHPDVKKNPAPIVRFAEFGDSSLNFELYFWAHVLDRWMIISDLNFAIDKMFRENNIEIPFPQRDLHIRSGKPAEKISTALTNNDINVDLKDPQIDG